jgi:hypothetical protein
MKCANPDCCQIAMDLKKGTLRLIELDVQPEERVIRSGSGFPVCSVCQDCSSFLTIKRWTRRGLILERKSDEPGSESRVREIALPIPTAPYRVLVRAATAKSA